MATNSSILAYKIPWTEEPGGLQSTGVAKSWIRLSTGQHSSIQLILRGYFSFSFMDIYPLILYWVNTNKLISSLW